MIYTSNVTITVEETIDADGEFGAFADVSADIFVQGAKAGHISVVVVYRQRIPPKCFLSAMDGHSSELQWVGETLFEPKYGRTKLLSLAEYDDMECDFVYIQTFHVDHQQKVDGSSDVGATALRQFMNHSFMKGQAAHDGGWRVSSAVYILDPEEAATAQELAELRSRDPHSSISRDSLVSGWTRADANQFLRNGFFQGEAIARYGGNKERLLVASYGQWSRPLRSHAQAEAVRFYVPTAKPKLPTGVNAEILEAVVDCVCSRGVTGAETMAPVIEAARLQTKLLQLMQAGGSLSLSFALQAACANNSLHAVKCILELDASTLNYRDNSNITPLMVAAADAAGRHNKDGIQDITIICILLAHGAQTDLLDEFGMTAYGRFLKQHVNDCCILQAMLGQPHGPEDSTPSVEFLKRKLLPHGGPTPCDMSGGEGIAQGFVDHRKDDRELDDSMMADSDY